MNKSIISTLFVALSFFAVNAQASVVPEIDASLSVLGLGLVAGIVALIAERKGR